MVEQTTQIRSTIRSARIVASEMRDETSLRGDSLRAHYPLWRRSSHRSLLQWNRYEKSRPSSSFLPAHCLLVHRCHCDVFP